MALQRNKKSIKGVHDMSHNRHRVVFSAARGQRIAVSKTASSFAGPSCPPLPALAFAALQLRHRWLRHQRQREFSPGQEAGDDLIHTNIQHHGRPARERAERGQHHAARGALQSRKQSVGEARARVRRPASQTASTCRTPTGTSAPNDCNNANPSGHAPWPESTLMCPASLSRTNSLPQARA